MNKIKYLREDCNKLKWLDKSNINSAFSVFAFAEKPNNVSNEEFQIIQENIIYVCKTIKNLYKDIDLHVYLHSKMTHWKLTSWLNSSQVFYSESLRNFFLSVAIENPHIFNFLSQVIFSYNKHNEFLIPKFIENNSLLNEYKNSFKQNFHKVCYFQYYYLNYLIKFKK